MANLTRFCLLFAALAVNAAYGLTCYDCQTDDLSKCNVTTMCNVGESCYTNATQDQHHVIYNMGCIQDSLCPGLSGSGSIVGKRHLSCRLCCSSDMCNDELCRSLAIDVIFEARDLYHIKPEDDVPYIFKNVIQNVGNGYDKSTGVFTAPVDGTYLFTIMLCPEMDRKLLLYAIVLDGVNQSIGSADTNELNHITLVLKTGQHVWIRNYYVPIFNYYLPNVNCNTFSGVLLHH